MNIENKHTGMLLRLVIEEGDIEEITKIDSLRNIPLLQKMDIDQDNPYHNETVLNHCLSVLREVCKITDNQTVRLAALFHDCGKPDTKVIDNGKARFHGHDKVGSKLAKEQLRDLEVPENIVQDVKRLIYLHMRPLGYINQKFGDKGVRRLIEAAHGNNVDVHDLMDLNKADILAHVNGGGDNLIGHQALRNHIRRLSE